MAAQNPQAMIERLKALLEPWHQGVADPAKAQEATLRRLLSIYAQTDYGIQHGAAGITTIEEYRRAFPVATYEDYQPLIQRVMAGELRLLLNEEPIGWAITRGTTKGTPKFIPMTPIDLRMRVSAARKLGCSASQRQRRSSMVSPGPMRYGYWSSAKSMK